jgi:hypothetical protein
MTLLVLMMLNTNLVAHDTFSKKTFLELNYVHKLTYIIPSRFVIVYLDLINIIRSVLIKFG